MKTKTDLSMYNPSATRQLLNLNPKISRMLPTSTDEEIVKHLNDNYHMTKEQVDFFVKNIDSRKTYAKRK